MLSEKPLFYVERKGQLQPICDDTVRIRIQKYADAAIADERPQSREPVVPGRRRQAPVPCKRVQVGIDGTRTAIGLRDQMIMVMLYDTGARIQEALGIRLCDLRLDRTPCSPLWQSGRSCGP